jgi:hypothetical protein
MFEITQDDVDRLEHESTGVIVEMIDALSDECWYRHDDVMVIAMFKRGMSILKARGHVN